jgi:hypothetical protein
MWRIGSVSSQYKAIASNPTLSSHERLNRGSGTAEIIRQTQEDSEGEVQPQRKQHKRKKSDVSVHASFRSMFS